MNYDDMIDRPHHVSQKHPRMSMANRGAQFASFKALTGFEDEIDEAARLTGTLHELDESGLDRLNSGFRRLTEEGSGQPHIRVTYFEPDPKKCGGRYTTMEGSFRFIDMGERRLKFTDGRYVPLENITDLEFSSDEDE